MIPRIARWLRALGPGVVTGAADDDPSGIATYSIAGATAGYSLLWAAVITVPMMAALMGMCARVGLVTGQGLVCALKRRFDRRIVLALVLLLVVANTLNIAADYSGMAASANLVIPMPEPFWIVLFGIGLVAGEIFFSYRAFARIAKWLCITLLAYVGTAILARPNWLAVLWNAVIPHFSLDRTWLTTALAVLGTTITPYLFIWQTAMCNEERHQKSLTEATGAEIADAHADVNSGMIFSNAMTFFIIVTTAATLGVAHMPIATAQDAAQALRPLAGNFASILFALGVVGTGLLAVPIIAGASAYAIADYFGWEDSLDDRPAKAPFFYAVVALGLIGGTVMAGLHLDPMTMLLYSAAFNGIAVVPLIYFVIVLARDPQILGAKTSSLIAARFGWLAFGLVATTSLAAIWFWIRPA